MNIVIVRVTFRLVLSFRDNARNSIYENVLQYLFRLVQTLSLLAQRKGFEPLDTFLHHTISNRARSTAPPSLQNACLFYNKSPRNASHLHGFIKNIFAMRRFPANDRGGGGVFFLPPPPPKLVFPWPFPLKGVVRRVVCPPPVKYCKIAF